jgi:hypothetical protein
VSRSLGSFLDFLNICWPLLTSDMDRAVSLQVFSCVSPHWDQCVDYNHFLVCHRQEKCCCITRYVYSFIPQFELPISLLCTYQQLAKSYFLCIRINSQFPQPIPVSELSTACASGLLLAGIAGSNPAVAWMFISCVCCVVLQVEICVTRRSLVQGCPTERECVIVCDQVLQ